ncbi:Serine beta-lactamase-like protein LACTB, mitochondrial [Orchesella cincta]|uniref:Serine beta-lactamase-like protein LACTB, mitochondrial n=1 Tax=Orchesella cincta TaxID=48709 RepID=A0A1D2MTH9_ORCCI|nr:Serine beta-lactamase-like protein LACTB, mitochondrial [Orchesella cincta]
MKSFTAFILFTSLSSSIGFLSTEQEATLDNLINSVIQRPNRIPGLGISIVKQITGEENYSVFTKGYGNSDVEYAVPVFNNTRFLIASISKSFTATVTCKFLHDTFPQHGESVLDIPIVQLAPNYQFVLSDSRFRYIQEKCGFRSRFEYSNNMIILAGEIVSHLSGAIPFDDMVRNLFERLGMDDSLIVDAVTDYETLSRMSRGYYLMPDGILRKLNATHYNGNSGAASGGVISTLLDMAKYMEFHLNEGMINGIQVVPKEVMQWLRSPSNFVEFTGWRLSDSGERGSGNFAYGLGLDLGIHRGWQRIAHDGDLSPFTARMSLFPVKKLGVFSFSNGPGPLPFQSGHEFLGNQVFDLIENQLEEKQFDKAFTNRKPEKAINCKVRTDPKRPKIQASELAGVYGHPYEGLFQVMYDGNASTPLSLQYGKRGTGLLSETEETNIYKIEWFGEILSLFYSYNGGQPLLDTLLQLHH